ncbi:hypothetical protein QR680_001226 [Steinernema hermaphroditum]|uniref:Glycine-rich protein n=1 Tax=Steinernema hermaphroditum TaxID=289476 RepID=A0AA39GXD6_9BILA|nr:hypothetical protein QR680_001226 [Steinernema hermaphroditum]
MRFVIVVLIFALLIGDGLLVPISARHETVEGDGSIGSLKSNATNVANRQKRWYEWWSVGFWPFWGPFGFWG